MSAAQRCPRIDLPRHPRLADPLAATLALRHRPQDRELVEVTYYPVLKNHALGRRMTRTIPAQRGENPYLAAERALEQSYKVRDYLIFDAHVAEDPFRGPGVRDFI